MGNNLKALRERTMLSQEQLASKVGTSQQNIDRWEKGTIPSNWIVPLADHLMCTMENLMGIVRATGETHRRGKHKDQDVSDNLPWGDIIILLETGDRLRHPINHIEYERLRTKLGGGWEFGELDKQSGDWLHIETMSNRLLLLNPLSIISLTVVGEPEEAPSHFYTAEEREILKNHHEMGDSILLNKEFDLTDADRDLIASTKDWTDEEREYQNDSARIHFRNGVKDMVLLDETFVRGLSTLINLDLSLAPTSFIMEGTDAIVYNRRIFLRHVVAIDIPADEYYVMENENFESDKEEEEGDDEEESRPPPKAKRTSKGKKGNNSGHVSKQMKA